jgi:hypothetical protein
VRSQSARSSSHGCHTCTAQTAPPRKKTSRRSPQGIETPQTTAARCWALISNHRPITAHVLPCSSHQENSNILIPNLHEPIQCEVVCPRLSFYPIFSIFTSCSHSHILAQLNLTATPRPIYIRVYLAFKTFRAPWRPPLPYTMPSLSIPIPCP